LEQFLIKNDWKTWKFILRTGNKSAVWEVGCWYFV
jgi:hypothetical protein